MKQWILKVVFGMVMVLVGYLVGSHPWQHNSSAVVHAQATQATTHVNMPKSWGPLVGTMTGVLVFQDRAGTIRLVAADTGVIGEVITRN